MGRLLRVFQLLRDPRVKALPRWLVIAALVYLVSPIDLVPEMVNPFIGYIDDAVFVWLAFRWLLRSDPDAKGPPEIRP